MTSLKKLEEEAARTKDQQVREQLLSLIHERREKREQIARERREKREQIARELKRSGNRVGWVIYAIVCAAVLFILVICAICSRL